MSRRLNSDSADHESARIVAIVVIFFISLIGFLFPLLLPSIKNEALKKDHWLLLKVNCFIFLYNYLLVLEFKIQIL